MILVADCSALVALSVCGSLNLLEHLFASIVVKEKGLIVEVAPLLQKIEQSDIYLSPDLIATVLELAGESCNR
jgi:uncharacterized protein